MFPLTHATYSKAYLLLQGCIDTRFVPLENAQCLWHFLCSIFQSVAGWVTLSIRSPLTKFGED